MAWLALLVACTPAWVDECGCGGGQICVENSAADTGASADARCLDIPAGCEVGGTNCGESNVDDACRQTLCGAGANAVGFSVECAQPVDGAAAWRADCPRP